MDTKPSPASKQQVAAASEQERLIVAAAAAAMATPGDSNNYLERGMRLEERPISLAQWMSPKSQGTLARVLKKCTPHKSFRPQTSLRLAWVKFGKREKSPKTGNGAPRLVSSSVASVSRLRRHTNGRSIGEISRRRPHLTLVAKKREREREVKSRGSIWLWGQVN